MEGSGGETSTLDAGMENMPRPGNIEEPEITTNQSTPTSNSDDEGRTPTSNSDDERLMDRELLKACSNGDRNLLRHLHLVNPDILLAVTPQSNNCLHIAAMLGHDTFAKEVWSKAPSSLFATNTNGETPLILALKAANASLAFDMTAAFQHQQHDFNEMLLKADRNGDNALHHAIRSGLPDLALELLNKELRLSEQVNKILESPMAMAVRKRYSQLVKKMLQIPNSSDTAPNGSKAFFTAVYDNNPGMIQLLLKERPALAIAINKYGNTALSDAAYAGDLKIVKLFLDHNPNLAYITNNDGDTPFSLAAFRGFVQVAKEIFRACPDSVYVTNNDGQNALHRAIKYERPNFVDYVLGTPNLHSLLNQPDIQGDIPLHYAARQCNPELIRLLLSNKRHDYTARNKLHRNALNTVISRKDMLKTIKWNESYTLLADALPIGWNEFGKYFTKKEIKKQAIEQVKSLTERYTANTSLVAALLATITFAAAFTLPGGYSSDPSETGFPIFARKATFQLFLISDTIAMCCSLAVAFLCVLATWEDLDYLLNYRRTTRALMWCAYGATSVAFGTGLFTVIAPKILWLATLILILCSILPFFSKIIGDWPLLMTRYRLGRRFRKELRPSI